MKLEEILENPVAFLRYSERYVNLGSPSGFGSINEVSAAYRPEHGNESFLLPLIPSQDMEVIGSTSLAVRGMPTHPDMTKDSTIAHLKVSPTASSRTVLVFSKEPYFIKLHFGGKIGRVSRQIRRKDVARAVYASELLEAQNDLAFGFLPEPAGVFSEKLGYGAIFRQLDAHPRRADNFLIPMFSLFAPDEKRPEDKLLVAQLLDANPASYGLLVETLSKFYVNSALQHNFLFESQAQNILLQIKKDLSIDRIVVRDFLDFYIDDDKEQVMRNLSVFAGEERKWFRSFIFDFKFGVYVLSPLENALKGCGYNEFRQDFIASLHDKLSGLGLKDKFASDMPAGAYGYGNTADIVVNHKPQLVPVGEPRYR
ncbi:MAG: hypothetical protein V1702_05060 [Candidatus Woesearchaeota archaeon]